MWLYILLLWIFFIGAGILLAAPLPVDIYDRKKLQVAEFLLRLTGEYLANHVEQIFGPNARNAFFRFVSSLGFLIPFPPPSNIKVYDTKMRGVRVRCYEPKNLRTKVALVYIHGGGWCTMKPDYYDNQLYWFVEQLGIKIFNIDYRLAPEYPFPIPINDCLDSVRHLHECADQYGIDGNKIILMGDSAGGNLAAVLSQKLKDEKYILCQILIYPVTSMFSFNLPSYQEYYKMFNGTAVLNPRAMARWSLMYLGVPAHSQNVKKLLRMKHISKELRSTPEYEKYIHGDIIRKTYSEDKFAKEETEIDPVLAEAFNKARDPAICPIFGISKDLPPAMVITCGYDVLRDEGIIYAQALREIGAKVGHYHYGRGFHGIFSMPRSELQPKMNSDIVQYLSEFL